MPVTQGIRDTKQMLSSEKQSDIYRQSVFMWINTS